MTMNRSWGWVPTDTEWKSARELVHTLAETVSILATIDQARAQIASQGEPS